MLLVPSTAVVRDGTSTVGQTFGNLVQVTNGLRESNVSSFAALTRCPDNEAVNE